MNPTQITQTLNLKTKPLLLITLLICSVIGVAFSTMPTAQAVGINTFPYTISSSGTYTLGTGYNSGTSTGSQSLIKKNSQKVRYMSLGDWFNGNF